MVSAHDRVKARAAANHEALGPVVVTAGKPQTQTGLATLRQEIEITDKPRLVLYDRFGVDLDATATDRLTTRLVVRHTDAARTRIASPDQPCASTGCDRYRS